MDSHVPLLSIISSGLYNSRYLLFASSVAFKRIRMQALGYARTWKTLCFINGGCGEEVFAHTNGFGDFVLFYRLGWPWPIHDCYLDRFCLQIDPSATSF